jgi:hypothetical protein
MLLVHLGCDHTSLSPDSFVGNYYMLALSPPDALSRPNSWLVSFPEPSHLRRGVPLGEDSSHAGAGVGADAGTQA